MHIKGKATDDRLVRDVYVRVWNRNAKIPVKKAFYQPNKLAGDRTKMEFEADIPLWAGSNLVQVFARESNEVQSLQTIVVLKRATDGSLVAQPTTPTDRPAPPAKKKPHGAAGGRAEVADARHDAGSRGAFQNVGALRTLAPPANFFGCRVFASRMRSFSFTFTLALSLACMGCGACGDHAPARGRPAGAPPTQVVARELRGCGTLGFVPGDGRAQIAEIPSLGGRQVFIEDINDDGVAVGGQTTADGNMHAIRYTDLGGVQDLSGLPGSARRATPAPSRRTAPSAATPTAPTGPASSSAIATPRRAGAARSARAAARSGI